MGRKEYTMLEISDILRRLKAGDSQRLIERQTGVDRKTIRKYIKLGRELGFELSTCEELTEMSLQIHQKLRNKQNSEKYLQPELRKIQPDIEHWFKEDKLTIKKIHKKVLRLGIQITYMSFYRYIRDTLKLNLKNTVRVADYEPGQVAEIDFGRLGMLYDPILKKKRVTHALSITLCYSRHQYVHLCHTQDMSEVIAGLEDAWEFFGGVPKRLIIDNMKQAVTKTTRYETAFNRTFYEYAAYRGMIIDNTVVRHPTGKPKVERNIHFIQNNFFKGEHFIDIKDAQKKAKAWCLIDAGLRIHGTTRKQPRQVFNQEEKESLQALIKALYDTPAWSDHSVHPDHHIRVRHALYSLPTEYIGKKVLVRSDSKLIRIYLKGTCIKVHPLKEPGQRCTDYDDYPEEKTGYAMNTCHYYINKIRASGEHCDIYIHKLLGGDFPWRNLRQAQKLIRLLDKYGKDDVNAACEYSLKFDLVNVFKLEHFLKEGLFKTDHSKFKVNIKHKIIHNRFERDNTYFKQKKHN